MKSYLRAMFPVQTETGWYEELEDASTKQDPRFQTVILQRLRVRVILISKSAMAFDVLSFGICKPFSCT